MHCVSCGRSFTVLPPVVFVVEVLNGALHRRRKRGAGGGQHTNISFATPTPPPPTIIHLHFPSISM